MALIKNAIARDLARDAVVLDLGDLQRQGAHIVQQARVEAARIVAEAQAERQRLLNGAAEQGRAEGFARGLEEGRKRGHDDALATAIDRHAETLSGLEAAWATALSEFAAQRDALIEHATSDVVRLAVELAGRVLKRTIEADPSVVVDQVRAALGVIVRPTEVVVAVHPLDRPIITAALPGLMAGFSVIRHAQVVDDERLTRGSCVVRMRGDEASPPAPGAGGSGGGGGTGGEIDASIRTQLERIVGLILPGAAAPAVAIEGGQPAAAGATDGAAEAASEALPPATPPGEAERGEASW